MAAPEDRAPPEPEGPSAQSPPVVVHLSGGLYRGGAETQLFRLLADPAPGLRHVVVSLTDEGVFGPELVEAGREVHTVGMNPSLPGPVSFSRLVRLLRRLRPAVIQGWMYHGNLMASAAAPLLKPRPAVIWNIRHSLHDPKADRLRTRLQIRLSGPVSRSVDTIVYNSQTAADHHAASGLSTDRVEIIPNGFDLTEFRPQPSAHAALRRVAGLPPKGIVIGSVGREHRVKSFPTLARAFAAVAAKRTDLYLVLIGPEAGSATQIESAAAPYGDRVRLLGMRSDVSELLPGFDVFVLSSTSESFPNALAEAMACGIRCITTNVGDAASILGVPEATVPPRNAQALAAAIDDRLSLDEEQTWEHGTSLRRRIAQAYSIGAVRARYHNMYKGILRSRS